MPIETLAGPLGEVRSSSTAGGGTALSTTAAVVPFLAGTNYVSIEGRNYSTAVVVKYALVPYLLVYKTADSLATITNYSSAAQDGDAGTDVVLSSLDTLANGDALWIGSHLPFRGVQVDVDAANGTASVLAGHYWDGNSVEALTVTDGSASAGATLAQDGAITWTMPTDWTPASLATVGAAAATIAHGGAELYWVRLTVSAGLDSSTTLNSLLALSRSTAYAELVTGRVVEMAVRRELGGLAGVEALTDAGTANLVVNCGVRQGGRFA